MAKDREELEDIDYEYYTAQIEEVTERYSGEIKAVFAPALDKLEPGTVRLLFDHFRQVIDEEIDDIEMELEEKIEEAAG